MPDPELKTKPGPLATGGLIAELEELGKTIAAAKAEIAAMRVDRIETDDIPFATGELDAIVEHTALATHSILEACESLDQVAENLEANRAGLLTDATTKIYEACSFQDIVGQRIAKVVTVLKQIDSKIGQIIYRAEHPDEPCPVDESPPAAVDDSHENLLNGPQLPDVAMKQSDIDQLLASMD